MQDNIQVSHSPQSQAVVRGSSEQRDGHTCGGERRGQGDRGARSITMSIIVLSDSKTTSATSEARWENISLHWDQE